jgi:Fe-S cluster biogenesis protein NfuA
MNPILGILLVGRIKELKGKCLGCWCSPDALKERGFSALAEKLKHVMVIS